MLTVYTHACLFKKNQDHGQQQSYAMSQIQDHGQNLLNLYLEDGIIPVCIICELTFCLLLINK